MAITYVSASNAAGQNAGATGTGTASITPTLPAGTTDNITRIFVVQVGTGVAGTTPASWTAVFKDTVIGSGTVAAGSGQRYMSCYYRDKDSSWTAMPAFTLASTSAPSHWVGAVAVNKSEVDATWNTPTASTAGSDYGTANTSHSATTGSLTTHSGGFLIIGTVANDNVTTSTPALSQSGATFGTVTERCDGGTATGNDVSGSLHTCSVTTGATAALTFTATLSAASEGGSIVIEQTETAAPAWSGPQFRSIGNLLAASTSLNANFDIPAGVAVGDLIVVLFHTLDTNNSQSVTGVPAGFALTASSPVVLSGMITYVYYKVATAADSDAGTYDFTWTGTAPYTRTGYAVCYTNVDGSAPIDVATSNSVDATATYPSVSVTTTNANELLVWLAVSFDGAGTVVSNPPAGFTTRANSNPDSTLLVTDRKRSTAGGSGTISTTAASGSGGKTVWMGALKGVPAVTAPAKPQVLTAAVMRAANY